MFSNGKTKWGQIVPQGNFPGQWGNTKIQTRKGGNGKTNREKRAVLLEMPGLESDRGLL